MNFQSIALPLLGSLTLGVGLYLQQLRPTATDADALRHRLQEMARELRELETTQITESSALSDQLPLKNDSGQVLRALERLAQGAGIADLGIEVLGETQRESEDESVFVPAPGDGPDGQADAAEPERRGISSLHVLRCRTIVRCEFGALARFLGSLERSAPTMRVRSLEVAPAGEVVRATVGVEAYALPNEDDQPWTPAAGPR